jgi:hypothetical protein
VAQVSNSASVHAHTCLVYPRVASLLIGLRRGNSPTTMRTRSVIGGYGGKYIVIWREVYSGKYTVAHAKDDSLPPYNILSTIYIHYILPAIYFSRGYTFFCVGIHPMPYNFTFQRVAVCYSKPLTAAVTSRSISVIDVCLAAFQVPGC